MWEEENEYEMAFEPYGMTYKERRRQKRIQRRMQQEGKPEPKTKDFVLMRLTELLIPEVLVSVIISIMISAKIIPSILFAVLIIMGLSLLAYIVYVTVTSMQLFWALGDARQYLIVNLGAYMAFAAISVVMRLIDIQVFSWLFLPTKLLTLFGISSWASLISVHVLNLFIILIMLVNVRSRAYFEMKNMENEEE